MLVGAQACKRPDVAGNHAHRIERAGRNRAEARVGLHLGIAMEPVVGCASLDKGTILASGNISVPGGNRRFESPGVNASDTSQLGKRAATHQVSRFDNSGEWQGRRLGVAEAVASNGTVTAMRNASADMSGGQARTMACTKSW